MKPINFKEATIVIAKDQPQYQPLPALVKQGPEREVVSCWKLSMLERIQILFTGRLWVSLWTFGHPLTPSYFTVKKEELVIPKNIWYLHRRLRVRVKDIDECYCKYLLEYKLRLFGFSIWVEGEYIFHFRDEWEQIFNTRVITDLFTKRRTNSLKRSSDRRIINAHFRKSAFTENPFLP